MYRFFHVYVLFQKMGSDKIDCICTYLIENVSNLRLFSCNVAISLFIFPWFLKLLGVSDNYNLIYYFQLIFQFDVHVNILKGKTYFMKIEWIATIFTLSA